MKFFMGKDIHFRSLAKDLLLVIGGGAVLASVLLAPNLAQIIGPIRRRIEFSEEGWKKNKVQRALKRLRMRRYATLTVRDGKTYIAITEQGKKRLRQFEFESMTLPQNDSRWDKKWRVVIFDIPEKNRKARVVFQKKLTMLGFFPLQKSVLVYPYPCEDEIDFLSEFLGIRRFLYFFETQTFGRADAKLKRHFDLL